MLSNYSFHNKLWRQRPTLPGCWGQNCFYLTNCFGNFGNWKFWKLEMFQMKVKGCCLLFLSVWCKFENWELSSRSWIILTRSNRSELLALSVVVFNVWVLEKVQIFSKYCKSFSLHFNTKSRSFPLLPYTCLTYLIMAVSNDWALVKVAHRQESTFSSQ